MGTFTAIKKREPAKSPIKENPLPLPGGSLRGQIIDVFGEIFLWWIAVMGVVGIVIQAWIDRYWPSGKPNPVVWTAILLVLGVVAIIRIRLKWRKIEDIGLGLEGERAVAEALDQLREGGYRVYHDLQEDGYNIDHVLIGPGGLFAIETKTRRKRGNQSVVFDGEHVLVGGHKPDRDPVVQAQASARRVRDILKQQTGKDVWVKPVVLFPGWYVEIRKRVTDLFVGNEKLFVKSFVYEHSKQVYSREEVDELARGMERHVRKTL